MKHRATGRPRGRPPSVPFDLGTKIYNALKRKMNPDTRMVRPQWKKLALELGVSRSTISREMPSLKSAGLIESVVMTSKTSEKFKYILYKIND
jgi:DNA-binding transcriptional ArsR family regulator